MALPVLDGNQSATTLSSVVTGGEHIVAHTVVSLGSTAISNITSAVSGSVVSISNFPSTQTIAGTVTANVGAVDQFALQSALEQYASNYADGWPVKYSDGASFPISGTVTANAFGVDIVNAVAQPIPLSDSGEAVVVDVRGGFGQSNVPISGTVTVGALPSGALTTRFGSVTTANTVQITSAVTNTSRKYLLAQNISAGTVTIGIGFSPTTTQGIQLTAGAGLTFDAFCPTGAVYWLGAVTGAAYTILEG